jgi:hypothetical protein
MLSLHLPNSTTALTDLVVTDLVCHLSACAFLVAEMERGLAL